MQVISPPVKEDLDEAFTRWTVLDALPFGFAERPGTSYFDKGLLAWSVPSRKALSGPLLDKFAEKVEKEVMRKLASVEYITVTVDGFERDRCLCYGVVYSVPEPVLVAVEETGGEREDADFLRSLMLRVQGGPYRVTYRVP